MAGLRDEIENEKTARRESLQRLKLLHEELGTASSKTKPVRTVVRTRPSQGGGLTAGSSGRVASTSKGKGKAREASNPYPIGEPLISHHISQTC
jgi:hypothetical protein